MTNMNASVRFDSSVCHGALRLAHWGLIQAQGADAPSFLHGQLSQDMAHHPQDQWRQAAFCSPKGRMLASFHTVRLSEDSYWLLVDAGVLPATLKRLSMFVMRAKCKLTDESAQIAVVGLAGTPALELAGAQPVGSVWASESGSVRYLRLSDVQGVARVVVVGPVAEVQPWLDCGPSLPDSTWNALQVLSGEARIELAGVDQFVPQMINFELIGGVNFQKGCYPGQEVVARSQYRGTLKRRLALLASTQPMSSGQEVFSSADPGQPAGMVVNAAPLPGGDWVALAELKLAAQAHSIHLGSAEGPVVSLGALPYAVPEGDA